MRREGQAQPGLIFVEDPGAVNCVVPLIESLAQSACPPALLACGHAVAMLKERGTFAVPLAPGTEASSLISTIDPRWVLVGTSENLDSFAFDLVAAAAEAGIPTIGIVDSAANAANRFRGRSNAPLTHAPDRLLLPDEWTAHEFARLGMPGELLHVVGHPHYDHLRTVRSALEREGRQSVRQRALPKAAQARKVVVFASEISTGLDPDQYLRSAAYTLHGSGSSQGRTEIVLEELLSGVDSLAARGVERPYLVLRRHPKESAQDLAQHLRAFDLVSSGSGVLDLLYAADLVVGLSSMLLLEAHLLGISVVSILPRDTERNWLPILRAGEVPVATSSGAVQAALSAALAREPIGSANEGALQDRVDTMSSTNRIVHLLSTLHPT